MDLDEYTETAVRHAAVTLQWQVSDAACAGDGYPISERGDEYTDRVAELIREDVTRFVTGNYQVLTEAGVTPEMAGHDLILTANGHGAGFWDRGLGEAGNTLTEATRGYSFDDAEFALWGDKADGDEHCSDEVAWLMVKNTVIVDELGMGA